MAIPHTSIPPKSPNTSTNPFAPRQYGEIQRVTDRVYIFRNITNSSFVIGDRTVAVIDTQVNMPTALELQRLIKSVTSKPIQYVINTHYHWDHTNGNALFKKEGATVISSKLTKEFMVLRAPRQKEFLAGRGFELGEDPFLPEAVFEEELELDLGNMPLRLFFAGSAETDDATAVHVVNEGVVMSGDTVMTGSFPIFGQPVWDEGLQDEQWMKTIQNLMRLGPRHIIPGHGPLAYEAEIEKFVRIQRYFLDEVGALVKKNLPIEEALKDLEPRLPEWITSLPVVWGTPRYAILRVYRSLYHGYTRGNDESGWQQSKPSAIPSAVKEIPRVETWPEFQNMAHEALEGGDAALAIAILKKATAVFPKPDAFAAYAEALIDASRAEPSVLEKGDFFQEARTAWDRALRLDPVHVPTLLGKGRYLTMMAYRGGDDPRQGMELLERIVGATHGSPLHKTERQRAEAEFYLGMGHRRLGDEGAAHAQFDKALATDPSFMPAHLAKKA